MRALVVACIVMTASQSRAEGEGEAARLFEKGREAKDQGDIIAACKLFEQSYDLERAAGTALNLGECEEVAGNWEYALELYEGAAKVFEQSDRAESARFARERANKLRAQIAPKPAPVPAAPASEQAKPSNLALGIGIGGLTASVIGGVAWWLAWRDIQTFKDSNPLGEGTIPPTFEVTEEDCGDVHFIDLEIQEKFENACAGHDRQAWLMPVTLISGAVGIVALTYYFWTKPRRAKSIAITPTASGGVVATFEW